MSFDFSAILLILSIATGIIWLCDSRFWRPKRIAAIPSQVELDKDSKAVKYKDPFVIDCARSFFPILIIVFILRAFWIEPFRIPSGSMEPTLLVGDFILVNKYTYGVRLPVINQLVIPINDPKRGDVMVFRYPVNPKQNFIKRVIGLPGDEVVYQDKVLFINGEPMTKALQETDTVTDFLGRPMNLTRWLEDLDGIEHEVYEQAGEGREVARYVVPEGSYFMMGDNRDNSDDSRVWGVVPEDHIVGKAFMVWMSWNGNDRRVRFDRIFQSID